MQIILRLLGDVDDDGEVTVLDVTAVVEAFGSFPGSAGWQPGADFDGDNEISVLDIIAVVVNFGNAKQS